MKEGGLGLVIGKFWPPHRGHKHLIETARRGCRELVAVVCDHPSQDIPAETRASWLREIHPGVRVLVVPDTVPDDDSEGWAAYTRKFLGRSPDVVFTSETYGDRYASFLGCRHVCVDLERKAVPISARFIREEPLKHWALLEPCVRAHYARRVVLVGAESTGKTTLARLLAEKFGTLWVPEYGREYTEKHAKAETEWTSEEFMHIAREQNRLEDEAARRCSGLLFCDTDSFATSLWHERYLGRLSPAVDALSDGRPRALTFLAGAEIPFVQDGTRDGKHIRHRMQERFIEELRRRGRRYVLLEGSVGERVERAAAECGRLLHG